MQTLWQDIAFATRTLRRQWPVTLVAVVSLALSIGGNAAVFSMVDAFLFRPLPFDRPERLVIFAERPEDTPPGSSQFTTSLPTWADLKERTRTLGEWAAVQPRTMSLRSGDRSEPVTARLVTPGFFEIVGTAPTRGRTFRPEEGVEGAPRVVLISHELRLERWGEEADPLGELITLDSEPWEIIGVLPPGFAFLSPGVDVWAPLTRSPTSAPRDRRDLFALARMTPSATMEQVRAEATGVGARLRAEHPDIQRGQVIDAYNLRYDFPLAQTRLLFGLLQGVVVVVLVIACVNIANLLLARSQDRSREVALRTVLGASRWRIVRQLLTESALVAGVGGAGGLVLGRLGIDAIARSFAGMLPASFTPALDGRVLGFTAALTFGAALAFGLAPAVQALRTDQAGALREGAGRRGGGRSRKRLSRGLVVAEIALSMVALATGSVILRSFLEIRSSRPGFDGSDLLVATISVPESTFQGDQGKRRLSEEVLVRARGLPGVAGAALTSALPQGFLPPTDSARIPGADAAPDGRNGWTVTKVTVSAGYLQALDIQLLTGRFFDERDAAGAEAVAAVDRTLAEARFPGVDPLGRTLVVGGVERRIVGVVAPVQQQLMSAPGTSNETVYLPHAQSPLVGTLVVETTGDPHLLAALVRDALQRIDPDLALPSVQTMEERIDQALVGIRVFNWVLGGFGLVALLLAALGTYGVLAYSVSQRRHEIGVRMAIGADAGAVVGMISRQGLGMAAIGLGLGLLATLPLFGLIRSVVSSFATVDPWTVVVIAAVLGGVTALAGWIPARRAALVDPVRTLRKE